MICIHHNDLDGRCSAAIVERFNFERPIIYYIETDYKDLPPSRRVIKGQDVIIVDFSYNPTEMAEIINHAKTVVWIDHHATAKDYPYQNLPGIRNFNDKQESGCELTWRYFTQLNNKAVMPHAVQLIGDYDKWALKMPFSKAFYEGMKLIPNGPRDKIWVGLLNDERILCSQISHDGEIAITYRNNYCDSLCRSFGYEAEIGGYKAYVCNQFMFGSGGFGERFNKYPLCLAYIYDGKKFTVSLYSETVDVSIIAKNYGGGGHKGAAGFVCEVLPFNKEG